MACAAFTVLTGSLWGHYPRPHNVAKDLGLRIQKNKTAPIQKRMPHFGQHNDLAYQILARIPSGQECETSAKGKACSRWFWLTGSHVHNASNTK